MNCKIINGKQLAEKIKTQLRQKIAKAKIEPSLAAILVGEDQPSHLYVNLKKKACEAVGINFHRYKFENNCTQEEIIETIKFLNNDPETNGILVQLPLPEKFDTNKIIQTIDPKKDVDGFHPQTLENMKANRPAIVSPVVLGVFEILKEIDKLPEKKVITIVCNHEIFAEPFIYLFGQNNKIFVTNIKNNNVQKICSQADLLITAIGKPFFITNEYIKKDAIIIDIGISKVKDETLGDVDFEQAIHRASYITPVPGGIGPMTIAMLLENTYKLYNQQKLIRIDK